MKKKMERKIRKKKEVGRRKERKRMMKDGVRWRERRRRREKRGRKKGKEKKERLGWCSGMKTRKKKIDFFFSISFFFLSFPQSYSFFSSPLSPLLLNLPQKKIKLKKKKQYLLG
jgi:hypothetical protein